MPLAPGFTEWLKAEDRRNMDLLIKKFENDGQFNKTSFYTDDTVIKDKIYYETQAKSAHNMWEMDGFKIGKTRDTYMAAHTELANFINRRYCQVPRAPKN